MNTVRKREERPSSNRERLDQISSSFVIPFRDKFPRLNAKKKKGETYVETSVEEVPETSLSSSSPPPSPPSLSSLLSKTKEAASSSLVIGNVSIRQRSIRNMANRNAQNQTRQTLHSTSIRSDTNREADNMTLQISPINSYDLRKRKNVYHTSRYVENDDENETTEERNSTWNECESLDLVVPMKIFRRRESTIEFETGSASLTTTFEKIDDHNNDIDAVDNDNYVDYIDEDDDEPNRNEYHVSQTNSSADGMPSSRENIPPPLTNTIRLFDWFDQSDIITYTNDSFGPFDDENNDPSSDMFGRETINLEMKRIRFAERHLEIRADVLNNFIIEIFNNHQNNGSNDKTNFALRTIESIRDRLRIASIHIRPEHIMPRDTYRAKIVIPWFCVVTTYDRATERQAANNAAYRLLRRLRHMVRFLCNFRRRLDRGHYRSSSLVTKCSHDAGTLLSIRRLPLDCVTKSEDITIQIDDFKKFVNHHLPTRPNSWKDVCDQVVRYLRELTDRIELPVDDSNRI